MTFKVEAVYRPSAVSPIMNGVNLSVAKRPDLEPAPALTSTPTSAPTSTWPEGDGSGHDAGARGTLPGGFRGALPGLALAVGGAVLAAGVASLVGPISMLVAAVVIGIAVGNAPIPVDRFRPGLTVAAKRILRAGVVLLGLRLSFGDMLALGTRGLLVVALTVAATFFGTQWIARRLGLSPSLGLVVATGYSICGASAIAAVEGSTDADEEEVAAAVGLVTVFGSLAIVVLPALAATLGLSDPQFAAWAGASVHDVAQVVATASPAGPSVVAGAMVVKLTRVSLLSPIVAGVSIHRRYVADRDASEADGARDENRPPILPLFVVGFLAAVAIRSTGLLDAGLAGVDLLGGARQLERWVLATALVGLGATVRVARLRRLGPRPLVLGALAWILVASISLVGIVVSGLS